MALVLKADSSTMNIPKVIETKNGMVFYGHYYNKNNLAPIVLEQFIISGAKSVLNTNKRVMPVAPANCSMVFNDDTIIADEYEPNIFYSIIYNTGANNYNLIKYKEIQNKIEFIKSVNLALYYDKYLGQDENYLYFAFRSSGDVVCTQNGVYIGSTVTIYQKSAFTQIAKISKQNLAHAQIGSYKYYYNTTATLSIPNCIRIFEDENYIYCGEFTNLIPHNSYLQRSILKFNIHRIVKSNSSVQEVKANIVDVNIDGVYNFFDNKDIFKISDNVIGFYLVSLTDKANPLKLIKLTLNETVVSNIVTIENVMFTWNEDKKSLSAFPDGVFYSYETFITKVGDKSFVSLIMYQNANQYVAAQIANQGIYTFEMIEANSLKLTDYNRISDSVIKGYLLSKDRRLLIIATATNTIFMKFDEEAGCYKITNTIEPVAYCVGFDLLERVWIMKSDAEVDIYSLSDATDFNMKFEKEYYDYMGTDIETFITIEAKNFAGEYISIEVELNIDGNAKFKDTDDLVIKIITPSDGKLDIPVIITGSNQVTVYPKILTEGESN